MLYVISCSNENQFQPEPEMENPEPELIFSNLPDSIKVETEIEFTFRLKGEDNYTLSIDTIFPTYNYTWIDFSLIPENTSVIPDIAIHNIKRRGACLKINGNPLSEDMPVQKEVENILRFTNPQVVGNYSLVFKIKDPKGRQYSKVLQLKVYSSPIYITFFAVDPWLDLGIFDKNYFNKLNEKYQSEPLDPVFAGKEVDTLYSQIVPMPGHPGKYTVPGKGTTVLVRQDGAKEFMYKCEQLTGSFSAFQVMWDNFVNASFVPQKTGFHCLEHNTFDDNILAGNYVYELSFTDFWGKVQKKNIVLTVLEKE